jgi:hypothetical protein
LSTISSSMRETLTKHSLTNSELKFLHDWNKSGAHSQVSESLPVSACSFHSRRTPAPRLVTP